MVDAVPLSFFELMWVLGDSLPLSSLPPPLYSLPLTPPPPRNEEQVSVALRWKRASERNASSLLLSDVAYLLRTQKGKGVQCRASDDPRFRRGLQSKREGDKDDVRAQDLSRGYHGPARLGQRDGVCEDYQKFRANAPLQRRHSEGQHQRPNR